MQNTARDTQPVTWTDIENAICSNSRRKLGLDSILVKSNNTESLGVEAPIQWMPSGWKYANSDFRATPISLALMATDPLYTVSSSNTQRGLEKDMATELASEFDSLYNKYNGRTRGWIKSHLNLELGKWAGGATDVPFDWTSLLDKKKVLSSLLDIICVKNSLRIAVWWSEHKKLSLWPLSESDDEGWRSAPIINVEVLTSGEAHVMLSPDGDMRVKPSLWANIFKTIGEWQWVRPCTSPSLSTKTATELRADYAEIAGDSAVAMLPKKIEKDTLSNIIYKYDWLKVRLSS